MGVLIVRIDDVRDKPEKISAELAVADLPTLADIVKTGEVTLVTPVQVEVSAAWEFDHIRVSGRVAAQVRLACSRCLAKFEDRISSEFVLFYTKAETSRQSDEEVELSEIDLVSVTYKGDEIDLMPAVEEQFIMELPVKPLCSEQCRGLCVSCGADLNAVDCGCSREIPTFAFGSLKGLKINK